MSAVGIIRDRITAAPSHWLPWREVMAIALYEPSFGYYRRGVRRIGRGGDFFTSVSVGPVFGVLLAEQAGQVWRSLGRPETFTLVEQGAHDGTLARDLLEAIRAHDPELFAVTKCLIVEPDPSLREAQRQTLHGFQVEHVTAWSEIGESVLGMAVCNELLDAFPVHRLVLEGGVWRELGVTCDDAGELRVVSAQLSNEALRQEAALLPRNLAEGHVTELNLDMLSWLRDIQQSQFSGIILIADYGHAAREYFAPERRAGGLRRYHQHQMDDRILEGLGECDLTAHVNFTRLTQAALRLDWELLEFIEQGRFLSRLAVNVMQRPGFLPNPAWTRQFQTLTHPGHLGHSFQIALFSQRAPEKLNCSHEYRDAAMRRLGMSDDPA